ncbi:MAG: peptide chain release factor N(5)-glutamine methyltransferase [Ignavibacteriaceae bacterium]
MLTVLEAINLSTEYLDKKGIESPKLNAELLLAHILKFKRIDLYLSFDRPLKQNEIDDYRNLLKRRAGFEPLQYILGKVEFYGLSFKVNSSALIPRPETEILVEHVINFVNENAVSPLRILDIGTGSGIIAVSLAKNLPDASITGIDISNDALELAKENAVLNSVDNQIEFVQADILNYGITDKYDIVVSNPPYVSLKDYAELKPELKVHEPRIALTDNSDGLNFYRQISSSSKNILKEGGRTFYELGQGQFEDVSKILEQNNFINIKTKKDYLGIERVITGEFIC